MPHIGVQRYCLSGMLSNPDSVHGHPLLDRPLPIRPPMAQPPFPASVSLYDPARYYDRCFSLVSQKLKSGISMLRSRLLRVRDAGSSVRADTARIYTHAILQTCALGVDGRRESGTCMIYATLASRRGCR